MTCGKKKRRQSLTVQTLGSVGSGRVPIVVSVIYPCFWTVNTVAWITVRTCFFLNVCFALNQSADVRMHGLQIYDHCKTYRSSFLDVRVLDISVYIYYIYVSFTVNRSPPFVYLFPVKTAAKRSPCSELKHRTDLLPMYMPVRSKSPPETTLPEHSSQCLSNRRLYCTVCLLHTGSAIVPSAKRDDLKSGEGRHWLFWSPSDCHPSVRSWRVGSPHS